MPARMFAVRALLMLVAPGVQPSYEELLRVKDRSTGRRWICSLAITCDAYMRPGVPLPTDFKAQAEALAKRVEADPSEPEELRYAAKCVDHYSG